MELDEFLDICNRENVSSPALLKQREKLNEDVFKYLNDESMKDFYIKFKQEVKTFKGYLISAIDGSDFEVPNTKQTCQRYQTELLANRKDCVRIKVSNCYDVLNHYVLDTLVEKYKYDEKKLAEKHLIKVKQLIGKFPLIRVMDRGYSSLRDMYHSTKNGDKFVVRLKTAHFKKEQSQMTSNDEWVDIGYQYDRIRAYRESDKELYEFYESGNTVKVRFVKVILKTGEVEILLTNLDNKEFTTEEIQYIYQLRWGIETSYHYLKESMKITNIASSKDCIIKQEIYSQMFVFNLLQGIQNDLEEEIEQEKYKHKMKININMAVGYIKKRLIFILLEEDTEKRSKLYDELDEKILKNIVPIRKERNYLRDKRNQNKYPITKRKTF